jgi:hypothetical protein
MIEKECKIHGVHSNWRHRENKEWLCRLCIHENKRRERINRNYSTIKRVDAEAAEQYKHDAAKGYVDVRRYLGGYSGVARFFKAPRQVAERIVTLNQIAKESPYQRGWRCSVCGVYKEDHQFFDIDHITPRSKGGADDYTNMQILCPNCHKCKSHSLPDWRK